MNNEILEHVENGEKDFTVDDIRYIRDDCIDEIMQEELACDEYMLGCFQPWVLAEVLPLSIVTIENSQANEECELLGKFIVEGGYVEILQKRYVGLDGYGHYFNSWDGSEEEMVIDGNEYHVFKMRA